MADLASVAGESATTEQEETDFGAGWNDPEFADKVEPEPPAEPVKPAAEEPPAEPVKPAAEEPPAEPVKPAAEEPPAEPVKPAAEEPPAEPVKPAAEEPPAEPVKPAAEAPDYRPSYDDVIRGVEEVKKATVREVRDLLKPADQPPARPAPTVVAKRVDLSGFKGAHLKEHLKKVREVDPDTADALEGLVNPLVGGLESAYTEIDGIRVSTTKQATDDATATAVATIEGKHPGWQETVKKPEFIAWLDAQPSFVQRTARETDNPTEFVEVMDTYAGANPPAAPAPAEPEPEDARAKARREAAVQPSTRTRVEKPPAGVLSEDEEFARGWEEAGKD